jgi:hypothetical protein
MSAPAISEREILDVIAAIESGAVTVVKDDVWDMGGCPEFVTSTGWRFLVFNDAGQWDYFESVTAPDGRRIEPLDFDDMATVNDYAPPSIEAMTRWGLDAEESRICWKFTHGGRPK